MVEVFGRAMNVGDYFLYCLLPTEFHTVFIGKILANGSYSLKCDNRVYVLQDKWRSNGVPLDASDKFFTGFYKLEGDKNLFERYYQEGRYKQESSLNLFYNRNVYKNNKLKDLFGRKLCAGDFVMYKRNLRQLTQNGLFYGIVLSDTEILSNTNVIQKPVLVYKIEQPCQQEKEIYRNIVRHYNEELQSKLYYAHEELKIGGVYKDKGSIYIYLGVYRCKLKELTDSTKGTMYQDMGWVQNRDLNLYLVLHLKVKRDAQMFELLKNSNVSMLREFVEVSGVNYWPRKLKWTIDDTILGDCIGRVCMIREKFVCRSDLVEFTFE